MTDTVISLLACESGRRDKDLNKALAKTIADENNKSAIKELVDNLSNPDKNIQSDCIETLYETGYIKPELIADSYPQFLELISEKNNRLIWGAMIAISTIVDLKHAEIFNSLNIITDAVDKGSVITIDCGVIIYAKLTRYPDYYETTNTLLMEQLRKCPIKQLAMYAERSKICITEKNKDEFVAILENRLNECERETQVKRITKVLKVVKEFN